MTPRHPTLRLALFFTALGFVALLALMPYLLTMMPTLLSTLESKSHLPIPELLLIQGVQTVLLIFGMTFLGLRMGARVGLHAPLASHLINRTPLPTTHWQRALLQAAVLGFGVGLCVLLMDSQIFQPMLPLPKTGAPLKMEAWKGFLASFYGGLVEELEVRLFFMGLMAWLLSKVFRREPVPQGVFVAAVIISSLAFAAGHIPAVSAVWDLTPPVVTRVMLLNTVVGIPLGVLFWKRGLETAMVAHFCADLALHVVGSV